MSKLVTTIPAVPAGLENSLSQFLSAVKKQVETREGLYKPVKDEAFLTVKQGRKLIDNSISELRKSVLKVNKDTKESHPKINIEKFENALNNLSDSVNTILGSRIFNQPIKENVLTDTFIFVGEQQPSDEAWKPMPGVGITSVGLYGVAEEGGVHKGRFLLSSYNVPGLAGTAFEPTLGDSISQGELRVGDDIAYDEIEDTLKGNSYLWCRADRGLEVNFSSPDFNTKISMNVAGLFGYGTDEKLKFGFTTIDLPHDDYPGGVIPAGTAYFAGDIWASEIRGVDGLTVRPDIYSNRKIVLNEDGLFGQDSIGKNVFGFTLKNISGFSAGTAFMVGDLILGDYGGGSGIWYDSSRKDLNIKGVNISIKEGEIEKEKSLEVKGNLSIKDEGDIQFYDGENGLLGHLKVVGSYPMSILSLYSSFALNLFAPTVIIGDGSLVTLRASSYTLVDCVLRPEEHNTYDLGTPDHRWYNVCTERILCTGKSVKIGDSSNRFTIRIGDDDFHNCYIY